MYKLSYYSGEKHYSDIITGSLALCKWKLKQITPSKLLTTKIKKL